MNPQAGPRTIPGRIPGPHVQPWSCHKRGPASTSLETRTSNLRGQFGLPAIGRLHRWQTVEPAGVTRMRGHGLQPGSWH